MAIRAPDGAKNILKTVFQDISPCQPEGRDCYRRQTANKDSCKVTCEGLYADVQFVNSTFGEKMKEREALDSLTNAYSAYKVAQVKNMALKDITDRAFFLDITEYTTVRVPYHPLQVVRIYFSTATYDKILNDVSVTLGDQISAIGGTMGLFAGFSVLSAVEVLYFVSKPLFSLVTRKLREFTF